MPSCSVSCMLSSFCTSCDLSSCKPLINYNSKPHCLYRKFNQLNKSLSGKLPLVGFLLEGVAIHMYHCTSSSDGCYHLRSVLLIELFRRVVCRDYESRVVKRNSCSFALSVASISIHPYLEIVAEARWVVVVKQDSLLTSVAIEPFVLCFKIDIGIFISGISGFSNSGRSPNPYPSDIWGLCCLSGGDLVGVNVLLKRQVSVESDKSLGHRFFCSNLEQLLVLLRLRTFLVKLSGLEAKLPGSLQACLLFKTIGGSSIVILDWLEVGLLTKLLECA